MIAYMRMDNDLHKIGNDIEDHQLEESFGE